MADKITPITPEEKLLAKAGGQDVEIPAGNTRFTRLLEAIAKNRESGDGEGGGVGGIPFTESDKAKLDSLTNPILLKDRVDSYDDLQSVKNPKTGWLYFVGSEDAVEFAEYIYTDKGKWEFIGYNSVDLSDYVKKTDYATNEKAGIMRINGYGLRMNTELHYPFVDCATEQQITLEQEPYRPVVPRHIPLFMQNYGITSKDQIPQMQSEIEGKVGFGDYATPTKAGVVKISSGDGAYGLVITSGGAVKITKAKENDVLSETGEYRPLMPEHIPIFMQNYNITKTVIPEMRSQEALNKSSLGLQRKNLLKNACQSHSRAGVDATVNPNGSIMLKGTNTNSAGNLIIYCNLATGETNIANQYVGSENAIPPGNYILSGGTSKCRVQLRVAQLPNDEGKSYLCEGADIEVPITEDDKYVWCRISIATGATVDETVYPMLRYAEITDGTYEPYVPDLQEQITALEARLAALEAPHAVSSLLPENPIYVKAASTDESTEQREVE